LKRAQTLAIIAFLLIIPAVTIPVYEGWISNLSDLVTQITSGLVLALLGGGTALWIRSRQTQQDQNPEKQTPLSGPTFPAAVSKEAWIADFDERFYVLKSATDPNLNYKASENLDPVFPKLFNLPSWDDPVLRRLSELLGFIASRLQEQSITEQMKARYLKWAYLMITDKKGKALLPVAKANLSDIIETMYHDSIPDPDPQIDRITVTLLQLFDPNSVGTLVEDATMGWSYTRFQQGWQNIDLKQVRVSNPKAFKEICDRLLERADKYPNLEVRSRSYRLWQGTLDP
jgi:hypothetical protein